MERDAAVSKQSGLTVKQWCEEHGIRENAYYYRLRKVREAAFNNERSGGERSVGDA